MSRKDRQGKVLRTGEYQRPSGTYQYKYKGNDGQRHTASATSLTALRAKEREIERDLLDGLHPDGQQDSINDVYAIWQATKTGLKQGVRRAYEYAYEHFVMAELGGLAVGDVKKSDIKKFYKDLYDKGIAVNTLDSVQTILHQVLEIAVEDDVIRRNPAAGALRDLKAEARQAGATKGQERHRALTPEEEQALVDFLRSRPRWRPYIIIMLQTGLRVGELTALRWCDVQGGVIAVDHNVTTYTGSDGHMVTEIQTPKTAAGTRVIPQTQDVQDALAELKARGQMCKDKLYDRRGRVYKDFICINRWGGRLKETDINRALRRICRDCKDIHPISSHALRHTFCTDLCRAGVGIRTIMDLMGHDDVQTTMRIYTEVTADMRASGIETYETYLQAVRETCETKNETDYDHIGQGQDSK